MKRAFVITALTALAITGTAFSVSAKDNNGRRGDHGPKIEFSELDVNGDGSVTADEIQAHFATRFATIDTDGNGALSADELSAHGEAQKAERHAKRTAKMIEHRDTNGDGALSIEEMQPKQAGTMFDRLDTDKDGAISTEEFAAAEGKGRGNGKGKGHGNGRGDGHGNGKSGNMRNGASE